MTLVKYIIQIECQYGILYSNNISQRLNTSEVRKYSSICASTIAQQWESTIYTQVQLLNRTFVIII